MNPSRTFVLAIALVLSWTTVSRSVSASPSPPLLRRDALLFDSNATGNWEIYATNVGGRSVRRMTNDPRYDTWWPRVAPTRDRILFMRTPPGAHDTDVSRASIWTMKADGSQPIRIVSAEQHGWDYLFHPEWSPDGTRIVMQAGPAGRIQIFVTDDRGRRPTPVLRAGGTPGAGTSFDPSWGADGQSIVFAGCPSDPCMPSLQEVYSVRLDGSSLKRLTDDTVADYDPYQSPDGKYISWTRAYASPLSPYAYGMLIMRSDGTDERTVINDGAANGKPSWASDSSTIYFHRKPVGRVTGFTIWRINRDGSGLTEITLTDSLSPAGLLSVTPPNAPDHEFPDVVRSIVRGDVGRR